MSSLLLGCGHNHQKKVHYEGVPDWAPPLVTLDFNPAVKPDLVWNLEHLPLPFADNSFAEVGAFDVLEHFGRQGDWQGWFDDMAEVHRILKPGGLFFAIVPVGAAAFSDPGHTRFISETWFAFLNQAWYDGQIERGTPATDYRFYWQRNFDILHLDRGELAVSAVLRKA